MSDGSEAVASDLERALEQIARAVEAVIPGNDVFDPKSVVRRWMANLEPDDRGRFLIFLLSDRWEQQLGSIARSVLAGATVWPTPQSESPRAPADPVAEAVAEAVVEAAAVVADPELVNV